jgi:hypothetical protein
MRIKLKPGCADQARQWAAEINRRREEAIATLRDEGVMVESVFFDHTSEGDFLIYYMKSENLKKASKVIKDSTHAIDAYHQKFKGCWESGQQLELLVDLDRIPDPSKSE